jgi:hypothetical protein
MQGVPGRVHAAGEQEIPRAQQFAELLGQAISTIRYLILTSQTSRPKKNSSVEGSGVLARSLYLISE